MTLRIVVPESVLPAEIQKRVYEQCKNHPESESPPQCFIDELSQLPPYNYYLLYSLSAHLSIVNQQSDVNKMNLSNLGMIFCSTLRIDRFCFNWLVGHWADCWQGCWTERDELEKTDHELWKKQRDNASDIQSPAATFDTHSSAPSSPATSSTVPHTPVPPSLLSQNSSLHSKKSTQSPSIASPDMTPSPSIASPQMTQSPSIASPQMTQSPLSIQPPATGTAGTTPIKCTSSETGSIACRSAPPTPRTPVPPTPYTPASFTMGDDRRMMVHSASDIIADYADDSDDGDEEVEEVRVINDKGKEKHSPIAIEHRLQAARKDADFETMAQTSENASPPEKAQPVIIEPIKKEKKEEAFTQPELRLEAMSLNSSQINSPRAEIPKATSSRPPNIRVPHSKIDTQKQSALPSHLQLVLPPLTPMSPLIAAIERKSG